MSPDEKVLIVGGGLAGLSCALRLHEANVPFLLLEGSESLGGRVHTDEVEGFRLDRGFQVLSTAYPEVREVDQKLIEVAKYMNAPIITNDFNLNKVAKLRGVTVLNVNELANALKPVVLPGETLKVFLIKEGKERDQAVAYLDDGTMVVVDAARHLIGTKVEVVVTSVLQTTAGKMIFGVWEEDPARRKQIVRRRHAE